ncbi:hypothetical protein [Paenibacillus harenae]|uniref:Uncharacterized protein n=1 Tax=Paenibacillus harenae TaxID=306543 RepID=A0ABT9U950_PAEHA|nr:hypothetical protein [Paenibacillus harenae]MDQ0063461.1 hypothetical protein [Paenibacillus harenae]MDQ0115782.1 hypothetical protein [Paenibacillus harenae]
MKFNRKRAFLLVIIACACMLLLYGLTYLPRKMMDANPQEVSQITIFDGGSGYELDITDPATIEHIVSDIGGVTFTKNKFALGYMGYSYRLTAYNHKGKVINRFIINSEDTVRYKGFFYKAQGETVDYEYLRQLASANTSR